MIESFPYQNNSSAEQSVLQGVTLTGIDLDVLQFSPELDGFVVPEQDAVRLLVFRAHTAQQTQEDLVSAAELVNRSLESQRIGNSVYGGGLYLGNSPQAVAVYNWKAGREIGAYLTPPILPADMYDARSNKVYMVRLGHLAVKHVSMRLTSKQVALGAINDKYGEAKVVVFNMGADAQAVHKLQASNTEFPIKPTWYLWRQPEALFRRVGTVTQPIMPRAIFRKRYLGGSVDKKKIGAQKQ